MPKTSVIMPTYNRADIISKSIESVLNQSFKDFELIIADDGSIDNTEAVVLSFRDPRIHYYKQEHSGKQTKTRNLAIKHSKSEYITFLDSDDLLAEDVLGKLIDFLENNPDYQAAFGRVEQIGEDINLSNMLKGLNPRSGYIFDDLLIASYVFCLGTTIRFKCLDKIGLFAEDLDVTIGEDWEFFLRLAHECKIKYLDVVVGFYVRHGNNISRDGIKANVDAIKILKYLSSKLNIAKKSLGRALSKRYFFLARSQMAANIMEYRANYRLSFFYSWTNLLGIFGLVLSLLPINIAKYVYNLADLIADQRYKVEHPCS